MSQQVISHKSAHDCLQEGELERRLACLAEAGPEAITVRLNELNAEWGAGRVARVLLGGLIILGFAMTAVQSPWWLILPALAGVFLIGSLLQ
jgi:hypothetical protein